MEALWRPAYVAIGSNLNSPRERVCEAFERLEKMPGIRCLRRSRLYRSRPMGPQDQPDFVNAVAGLLTQWPPAQLLRQMLGVEQAMGRHRGERWGPRVIDLDLVWMNGGVVSDAELTLPHPGVSSRNFVLYPLADIAPTLDIPGCGNVEILMRKVGAAGIFILE